MSRRGHNEGTIAVRTYSKKDGTTTKRFVAQLPLDASGKRPSLGSFTTRAQARTALQNAQVAKARGTLVLSKTPTVAEWFETWLGGRTGIAYRTRVDYQQNLRMIRPYIGRIRLDQLTEQHLGEMWRKLTVGLTPDDKPCSMLAATTLTKRHAHLHAAMGAAVKSRSISLTNNPTDDVKPEKGERREISPLSEDEVRRLFAATAYDSEYALWVVLITNGCRASECRGLRWRDISLDRRRMSICSSIHRETGKGWVDGPTKTKKSRVVSLRPDAVAAIKAHRARQAEMQDAAGPAWHDRDYVFTNDDGTPLDDKTMQRKLDTACEKAGIPRRTIKEIRHTFAILGLVHNVPVKVISEALGHSTIRMTYDIYAHVIMGLQEESLSHLDDLFLHA